MPLIREAIVITVNALGEPHLAPLGLIAEGELQPGVFASLTLVDITPHMEASGVAHILGFMRAHLADGFASPDEVASLVAYVASSLASAITGAALRVDGGVIKSAF